MTRTGDWMQTHSGRAYYPCDPRPEDVDIKDIAQALSMQCRYNGHCSKFYSVAEHSVLLSLVVPEEHALVALLHDATEAYVCDVPRPLKPFLSNFQHLEDLNWRAIAVKFGLPLEIPAIVKDFDLDICRLEMAYLMKDPPIPIEWPREEPPMVSVLCMPPKTAKRFFMNRYRHLMKGKIRWTS